MKKLYLLIILSTVIFTGLKAANFIYIQKTTDFGKTSHEITKIVCIAPDVSVFGTKGKKLKRVYNTGFNHLFYSSLASTAKENKIKLEVVNTDDLKNTDLSFFNDLIPLKQEISAANFNQESGFTNLKSFLRDGIHYKPFLVPPHISPEFSYLSKQYGTPYFMICGLYEEQSQSLYLQVLVNVETSEVLYREIKGVAQPMNSRNMIPFLYDSFAMMKKK